MAFIAVAFIQNLPLISQFHPSNYVIFVSLVCAWHERPSLSMEAASARVSWQISPWFDLVVLRPQLKNALVYGSSAVHFHHRWTVVRFHLVPDQRRTVAGRWSLQRGRRGSKSGASRRSQRPRTSPSRVLRLTPVISQTFSTICDSLTSSVVSLPATFEHLIFANANVLGPWLCDHRHDLGACFPILLHGKTHWRDACKRWNRDGIDQAVDNGDWTKQGFSYGSLSCKDSNHVYFVSYIIINFIVCLSLSFFFLENITFFCKENRFFSLFFSNSNIDFLATDTRVLFNVFSVIGLVANRALDFWDITWGLRDLIVAYGHNFRKVLGSAFTIGSMDFNHMFFKRSTTQGALNELHWRPGIIATIGLSSAVMARTWSRWMATVSLRRLDSDVVLRAGRRTDTSWPPSGTLSGWGIIRTSTCTCTKKARNKWLITKLDD